MVAAMNATSPPELSGRGLRAAKTLFKTKPQRTVEPGRRTDRTSSAAPRRAWVPSCRAIEQHPHPGRTSKAVTAARRQRRQRCPAQWAHRLGPGQGPVGWATGVGLRAGRRPRPQSRARVARGQCRPGHVAAGLAASAGGLRKGVRESVPPPVRASTVGWRLFPPPGRAPRAGGVT